MASRLMPRLIIRVACVWAQLMGMDVADTGALGHPIDVTMDGAFVEGIAVVALDQAT